MPSPSTSLDLTPLLAEQRARLVTDQVAPRPGLAVALHEHDDGTWWTELALPRWPTPGTRLRLCADSRRELLAVLADWQPHVESLQDLCAALARNDLATARAPWQTLAASAAPLRRHAIAAYVRWPEDVAVQTFLAVLCLALGRTAEAKFHFLRAGGRPCIGPPYALLVGASAMQLCHQSEAARVLLGALRCAVEIAKLAQLCRDLPPHLLWTRPDLLRAVRGVVLVGGGQRCAADWRRIGVVHLLAIDDARLDDLFTARPPLAAQFNLLQVEQPELLQRTLAGAAHALRGFDLLSLALGAELTCGDPGARHRLEAHLAEAGFEKLAQRPSGGSQRAQALFVRRGILR